MHWIIGHACTHSSCVISSRYLSKDLIYQDISGLRSPVGAAWTIFFKVLFTTLVLSETCFLGGGFWFGMIHMNKEIHELQRLSQKYFFFIFSIMFLWYWRREALCFIFTYIFWGFREFDTENTLFAIMLICSFDIAQKQQTTPQSKNRVWHS